MTNAILTNRVTRSWRMSVFLALGLISIQSLRVDARKCPDCEAQYLTCTWNCYGDEGYKPTCMQRQSYMDGDAGPDPTDVEVYANQCDADCYAKAFEDFEFIERFEPQYEQQVNTTCESVWRAKQALDYEFYSSGFLYEGLLPERANLPQWLQEELNTVETNSVDEAEIDTILAECRICNPSVSVASVVDVPTQDTEVPAPAPSPVAALSPMPVIAIPPIVNPPTANVPEPSAIPEPLPSPSPSQQVAPSQEKSAGDRAHHNIITMAVIATVMIKIVVYW